MLTSLRGEVSIEFIVFVGIILVFFIFFFGIIGIKTRDINQSTVFDDAQSIANNVADEINIAARFDGFYRQFYLPSDLINGQEYEIHINNSLRFVEISWGEDNSVMSSIVTNTTTGNMSAGYVTIRNNNGVVSIEG